MYYFSVAENLIKEIQLPQKPERDSARQNVMS